ncbi:acyl-CoA synthetase MbcS [Terrilactibacillus laevilacticus]|uniref:acyl-CoA synthetase MbcS n=1 Tax=Terrilactibacillus laevilacticus TaxID=1380157 RepID=UPI00114691DE|nr:acyl--CoA ligase [Terrilactibacillus laevilacticus]
MELRDLIAPDQYNLTSEIEAFASDKTAIIWEDDTGEQKKVTYNELISRANQLANGLTRLGLTKGDKVLVMVPRLIEAYVVYLGCLKAGMVLIPGSEMLRTKDIHYRIHQGEAKAVISFKDFCPQIDRITDPTPTLKFKFSIGGKVEGWETLESITNPESETFQTVATKQDDVAFLTYTSGTTGNPKGVVHSHGWAYAHLRIAPTRWLNISENDTVWATAGPGWQKWVWSPFLSVLGKGATGFVYHGRFKPEKQLALLEKHQINVLCCTPTEYRLMAKVDHLSDFDLSQLHSAVSAGEPLNREVITVFQNAFGIQVRDGYGQTESTLLIGTLKGMEIRPGSMGKPLLSEFITIVDEEGHPVPPGVEGNIALRRDFPAQFKTYYKEPKRLEAAIRGNYFLTGDRATRDEDNYFWFQGRRDDIIISSGYTIGPFEVEDALMKHKAVKECAAVASPDEIRGNIVKAFIVLKDGYSGSEELIKELQTTVKENTAPYKYPRAIEFVEELPKTDSGKIRRVDLRNRELQAAKRS